jgi:hypothetical protein
VSPDAYLHLLWRLSKRHLQYLRVYAEILERRERPTLQKVADRMGVTRQTVWQLEQQPAFRGWLVGQLRRDHPCHWHGPWLDYDNVDVPGPPDSNGQPRRAYAVRRVNEQEAEVVRRVFELCAHGFGLSAIAKQLNAEGARSPRAQQGRPNGWAPASVREVLYRTTYRGEVIWNRSKKRDQWARSAARTGPRSIWIRLEAPELRIVSDLQWQRAHERLDSTRARYLRFTNGRVIGRPPATGTKYLLSGLLTCSQCGSSLEARSRSHGKRRVMFYGCAAHHRRGPSVCSNSLTIPMEHADGAVLSTVEEVLLVPEVVETVVDRVGESVRSARSSDGRPGIERKLTALEQEIGRLAGAIASGGDVPAIVEAIKQREQRRQELTATLACQAPPPALLDCRRARSEARRLLGEWRGLLRRHVAQGQQILRKLIDGRLTFEPREDEKGRFYAFSGVGTVKKLLAGLVPQNVASPRGLTPFTISAWPSFVVGHVGRAA